MAKPGAVAKSARFLGQRQAALDREVGEACEVVGARLEEEEEGLGRRVPFPSVARDRLRPFLSPSRP